MIKVGIVGGAGYTGGELLRILVNHPEVSLAFVHSSSQAGKRIDAVHTDLLGDTQLSFTNSLSNTIDVLANSIFVLIRISDGTIIASSENIIPCARIPIYAPKLPV